MSLLALAQVALVAMLPFLLVPPLAPMWWVAMWLCAPVMVSAEAVTCLCMLARLMPGVAVRLQCTVVRATLESVGKSKY